MLSSRMINLCPYIPGEQPKDRVYIKLNANENPYAPADAVTEAIADFVKAHPEKISLYPDPDSNELRKAIAKMLNVTGGCLCRSYVGAEKCTPCECDKLTFEIKPENIYVGNGSDEVLSFLYYAFFDEGASLISPEFSYSFYPVYAGFYGVELDKVPLRTDWSLNIDEMTRRAVQKNAPTIFANPNAPTGRGLSRTEIRAMLEAAPKDKVFVVDEAYCDFGGESVIGLIKDFENLVVVRTFSKSMCGAGMRLGFIVANEHLIKAVTTVKNSVNHFPIDAVAQVAGIASCDAVSYYAECAKKIVDERNEFAQFLQEQSWEVIESQTNFLFAKHPKVSGADVYCKIKERGILVRHFATKGIEDYVRITIGTNEQMQVLRDAVSELR